MAINRAPKGPLIPTTAPLSNNHRLSPTDSSAQKLLSTLSRTSLLDLAATWCSPEHASTCGPYILDEDFPDDTEEDANNPWTAANSLEELYQLYRDELGTRRGTKRELLDRIMEGDWRRGLTLEQIAMAETRAVLDNSSAKRWAALEIYDKQTSNGGSSQSKPPKLNSKAFTRALHSHLSALTKVHYHTTTPASHPLTIIRLALYDSPYSTASLPTAGSKSLFLAFPHHAPSYIYVARPSASLASSDFDPESSSLMAFVIKSIGPALSRPGTRFALRPTNLTARSLDTLLTMRGAQGGNAVGGGWSIFTDQEDGTERGGALSAGPAGESKTGLEKVVDVRRKKRKSEEKDQENQTINPNAPFQHGNPEASLPKSKKTRLEYEAAARFGVASVPSAENSTALPRFDVRVQDPLFPSQSTSRVTEKAKDGNVRISFAGKDVFAGIRALTELGVIKAKEMPGWLTGEGGVSVGIVKDGRLKAWEGGL